MPASSRSSKACTECRQVKLKCDSKLSFPEPCSRCKTRNLVCTFDPTFKRTPTKGQLERVTKQLNQLQSALGLPQHRYLPDYLHVPSTGSRTSSVGSQSSVPSPETSAVPRTVPLQPETYFGLSDSTVDVPEIFRLGSFQISSERVKQLFVHFARQQYRHLPVIDTRRNYAELHHTTPFLFWSIVVVAIRSSNLMNELIDTIEKPYNEFVGRVVVKSPLSLASIQGLLLLCLWPFGVRHQRQDPSWNLCNIALSATIHQDLPGKILRKKGWPNEEEQIGCRTWLACFYVSSCLSASLAVSPPLRTSEDLTNVSKALAIGGSTGEFASQLEIQRQVANYTSVLRDQSLIESSSAIQMYDKELSAIPAHFKEHWTKESEFCLLVAKLNLYTLVILSARSGQSSTPTSSIPGPQNSVGICLLKGFHVAVKMISLYSQLMDQISQKPYDDTDVIPTYYTLPKSYHHSFAQATFFLLRFTTAGSQFPESDRDIARNHIRLAHEIYLRNSQKPDDEPERDAHVIETLSRNGEGENDFPDSQDLSIVRLTAKRAAAIRGKSSSYDAPVPEVPAPASTESIPEAVGVGTSSVPNAQGDSAAFDFQYTDNWLPYFDVPNEVWDINNYPGTMPPVADWSGQTTMMNYSTY
ncbi:uncharacterized protein HMPREF1541_03158 [Cyphellophora europaea CBS 101466]|uniref:Zn(2)-C6 fungal-type domain-containing protein n=1 Tax=Cyphellophora europaea (strain CBS 101466) TaxID=1220924 RepID=W2RZK3_CYPE1|nr:uncharacterized protein HMPREF1541_03158 [Cyphellophora europaea CBS 101466]ETN41223.1 hypothetical protein HMPREF1541_03158 [Cyphellophora europaea CBS 101466]